MISVNDNQTCTRVSLSMHATAGIFIKANWWWSYIYNSLILRTIHDDEDAEK